MIAPMRMAAGRPLRARVMIITTSARINCTALVSVIVSGRCFVGLRCRALALNRLVVVVPPSVRTARRQCGIVMIMR
ncbi:hypothetical protein GCM10017621_29750 [Maricaulis virginensis]|uniref:Uncharacterized protein n=1 Tax=Maricaulis virginensis TaxID=144022 RepID=A0A9W6IPV9_9PROT|nr:hypothetical protein GCM10017621_29750 [Maricaulis virginensis]